MSTYAFDNIMIVGCMKTFMFSWLFKEKAHEYIFVLPGPFCMKKGVIFSAVQRYEGYINRMVLMSLFDNLLECICSLVMFSSTMFINS
jgi:hypothetical protein